MNVASLVGNLVRDPELRTANSGTAVCTFTIAVNRHRAADGTQNADFIPIVTFKAQAENCAKYLVKGRKVTVVGSIQTRSYDKDGTKRYVTEVIANEVTFLPSAAAGGQSTGAQAGGGNAGYVGGAGTGGGSYSDYQQAIANDELPF